MIYSYFFLLCNIYISYWLYCMIVFLSNLRVICVTVSCSRLDTRLFKMSFAYRNLLHFSVYFVMLVSNDYCFSFYVIPTNKLMKKRRA